MITLIKKLALYLLAIAGFTNPVFSQSLPDSTIKKIDSLFLQWDNKNSPGCTIGVVINDSLVYTRGFGMANLEYDIPNTPATIYHMASISKQFTAFSIVLLAKQGKLQLDDDIRKYLKWFPDLKQKITIRNLLNHTSGIRDQWQLLAISGTRLDDVITQDHIIKILSKQQALNFVPGAKYSYSNSGFTMLAEIVKAVSGQSLRQFTDSAIFKPLGMTHTHFHDDYTEIEKGRSYSYGRTDSTHFTNSVLSYSNAGATSLFTNITDMSKWLINFSGHTVGDQKDIEQLTKRGKLNDGKEQDYALGIVSDTYKGWKQYSHGGADAGYRTFINYLPDLKTGFIVFSNVGDFNSGNRAYEIASLFVKDSSKNVEKKAKRDSSLAILKNIAAVKKFAGDYMSDDGLPVNFFIKENKLYSDIYGSQDVWIKEPKDSFSMLNAPQVKLFLNIVHGDTTASLSAPGESYALKKIQKDTTLPDARLKLYTGVYYCPELDCKYGIILKDHHLVLTNNKYNDAPLKMNGKDHLLNDNWWMNHLVVLRDAKTTITGFEVNSGRTMHVRFNKIQ